MRKVTHRRQSFGISLRVNEILLKRDRKNRSLQDMHRHGTMKKRFSIHSNGPCLLERRISEHPHFKHTAGFMTASIRTLLPAMVGRHNRRFKKGRHRRFDLRRRKESTQDVYELRFTLKKGNLYLETVNL